jgi:hypothetical protein
MTKRTLFLGIGACALAGVIGAGEARADRDMGGAPAVCAPTNSLSNQIVTYINGAAGNTSSRRRAVVVCGSVRLDQNAPAQISLGYNDAATGDLVSCTARISSWDGTVTIWSQVQSSSSSGTDAQGSFLFQPPQTAVGYLSVVCTIPASESGHVSTVRGISLS